MRLALLVSGLSAFGQQVPFVELFQVDSKQPHDVRLSEKWTRDGVRTFNFSFASPVGGRVPGLLLTPDGSQRHLLPLPQPLKSRDRQGAVKLPGHSLWPLDDERLAPAQPQ